MIPKPIFGILALQVAALALAGWVGSGQPVWMALAAPAVVAGVWLEAWRARSSAFSGVVLLFGVIAVLMAEYQLGRLAADWPARSQIWENEVQLQLEDALDDLLDRGESAASALARRWEEGTLGEGPALPSGLRGPGVNALALFGSDGTLVAWDGNHQGPFSKEVRSASPRYVYRDGALFGYLYTAHPLPDGVGTAVAASLMRSDLPPPLDPPDDDFLTRFEARSGANIQVTRADRALDGSIWDLQWEDETLFSVTLLPASEAEARAQLELAWQRVVTALLLLGWVLAAVGVRGKVIGAAMSGAGLVLIILLLPLGRITGLGRLFSPADFLLPGPFALTLGDLLALGVAGALALGFIPWERLPRLPRSVAAAGGICLAGVGLLALEAGVSRDFLAGEEFGWVVFQGVGVTLALLAFGLAVLLGRSRAEQGGRWLVLGATLVAGGALALGWMGWGAGSPGVPTWVVVLWGLPLWGMVWSLPSGPGWSRAVMRWAFVGILAGTMVLPWAWDRRVESRMAAAEERMDRLGTRADPFLEFLLLRAGEQAGALAEAEADAVEILYGAWTGSGLAWEGLPLWITIWSPAGEPHEELRIGVSDSRPPLPSDMLEESRAEVRVVVRRFDLADAHYVGVAPLAGGGWVSVVVPPRRLLTGASPFGPLFSPARSEPDPLVLIPLLPGEAPGETEEVHWIATPEGWKGELYLAYPDEVYHAHYLLELPTTLLLIARGTLLLLLNMVVLGLLWAMGRWIGEGEWVDVSDWTGAVASFRGRVTVALFAFFLVPAILFGTLAYRTLAGAAVRTAEALAERAVEDAASWYFEADGAMDVLARQVGSDLLLYEGGELVGGSLPELVELGLYEGWLPPAMHRDMAAGEELMTTARSSLGGWDYVVAYRRMPGGTVLAAPTPLQAGAMALRQRDVADLIGFSVLLGGICSILLSLMVGRALSRPIQTLRVASERVGGGNMGVHLPDGRTDEFGAVFDAFNRMVDRLAQTRRELLRSSRRTRAIVEEVATGVVALDSEARVTLANPRAADLLGVPLEVGRHLPAAGDIGLPADALVTWVERYYRDGLREAGTEIASGERRIRVRARRIARQGPLEGAVLTLEDVTDELRTERILAWGEMAQQVAHEVKNPLTPIKLGIQHIRRAWDHRQPDYEEILNRNVDAILTEIDRLSSIASSFSRYAAPTPSGAAPLEPVQVDQVIGDIFDLYGAGAGAVEFQFSRSDSIPKVRARSGEMKEVLVNLLENARAALPEGGNVSVATEVLNGEIELRVEDDGTGIPADLLPRIFDPYFSTRSTGTGLGLAIVRRIVESWGGSVRAESRLGQGTTIRVRVVPWSTDAAAETHPTGGGADSETSD